MKSATIVIATPHTRNDALEEKLRADLPTYRIKRLRQKTELSVETLERLAPEFIFFPHWSWLIPPEIYLRWPCVIFHMTDLPFGRGGSPLQNLIVRGFQETRLSALKCEAGLDTGPIYLQRPLSLAGSAEEILCRASNLIGEMIVEIVNAHPVPQAQRGEVVEFKRRRPEDGDLTPLQTQRQIYDFIRMLDAEGYPPAFIEHGNFRFEFSAATLAGDVIEAKVRIRKNEQ